MNMHLNSAAWNRGIGRGNTLGVALLVAAIALCVPALGFGQSVDELVARNTAARGGAAAWRAVNSMELRGRVDVGQGMTVPYRLEQQRPARMRMELDFNGQTAVQTYDGTAGWKLRPFMGRTDAEPMTPEELTSAADTADIHGLLFDYRERGHKLQLLGQESVDGRNTHKLKVTLPGGSERWVYLDAQTGLEVKIESMRRIGKKDYRVETFFKDWQTTDGLLIARLQETHTEGEKAAPHPLTVQSVRVNPPIAADRFGRPASVARKGE